MLFQFPVILLENKKISAITTKLIKNKKSIFSILISFFTSGYNKHQVKK